MNIEKLRESIAAEKQRSAWDRGVTQYALELVDELAEQIGGGYVDLAELAKPRTLRAVLLNGAKDWRESIAYYSGLNGLEIKGIEYGADDYIYCVSGCWYGGKAAQRYHKCKVQYTRRGAPYIRVHGYQVLLNECLGMGG